MDTIVLKTGEHELYNITDSVIEIVERSGVKDGLCLVYTPHSTAGVLVACGIDPNALTDVDNFIRKLVPIETPFSHTCDPRTDAAGHLKAILTNVQQTFPVENGKIMLGSSQEIYFAEYDGPRERTVYVKVVGE